MGRSPLLDTFGEREACLEVIEMLAAGFDLASWVLVGAAILLLAAIVVVSAMFQRSEARKAARDAAAAEEERSARQRHPAGRAA